MDQTQIIVAPVNNDITRALEKRIARLRTKRKLQPQGQHEMTPLDMEIDRHIRSLRLAQKWAVNKGQGHAQDSN